ncbi:3-hydroxyisobutyrate dehydrogenase [Roseomonas sp. NAR14]|uniref:3-hydroxyisobutyrate dehydrogenase n=1 Tax=Roseomonas acroporae TaxID=2937791 RepID=A0A9X2BWS8_9PROT|nr:3-hydroxyisobutyrate dehydrogenase [Roseomonas acroporae]MCK8786416.1 3-hydroxyisobutyrate dehydrogenase [Roseomonas acroporae]
MARIGFVGLGNMGAPMARNLLKAGHDVAVFDLQASAVVALAEAGARAAAASADAAAGADFVVTMLPAGRHVREVWLGSGGMGSGGVGSEGMGSGSKGGGAGLAAAAGPDAVLIDCSTIDVATAREVAAAVGRPMLDAPVSGGVMGAEAGTLTFMVGGPADAFGRAEPILAAMGRTVVHCGEAGAGQAAKVCNNMLLAISMIGTCEAFVLAERLGLSHQALFDVASRSSGQCWSLTTYCPVPGPVPNSPANRDYRPGFAAALMAKDLGLSQQAARETGAGTPLGAASLALYERFLAAGGEGKDFSGIIAMLREDGGTASAAPG